MAFQVDDRILIVEDDPIICESIRAVLDYCGFTCATAADAASAMGRLRKGNPDAIVVDLGLPDCDGIELIAAMRHASDVPIIVVSGRTAEADKIAALDSGADDYIQKPCLPGELVARVRAKLRQYRSHPRNQSDTPYEMGPDTECGLSRMERSLLALLVHHQGATVPEDQIIAALWGSASNATGADLRTLVLKLRRKLEELRQPLFVINERGVGYYVSGWGRFPRRRRDEAASTQRAVQVPLLHEHPGAQGTAQAAGSHDDRVAIPLRSGRRERD